MGAMDAAPTTARGVSGELAAARWVAAAAAARQDTLVARHFSTAPFFSAATTAAPREEALCLVMVLMMGEEPIAGERGECSSVGYELEWPSMYLMMVCGR